METNLEDIFDLARWERLQIRRRCELCRGVDIAKNMVFVDEKEIPARFAGYYHQQCAKEIKTAYQKVCVVCGRKYSMRREDGNQELCPKCDMGIYRQLQSILEAQTRRSKRHGLPATLTMKEWIQTIKDFDWACAYCGRQPFTDIDHFIPVQRGGGTTKDNCVPCCNICNSHKHKNDPFVVFPRTAPKIAEYLKSRV